MNSLTKHQRRLVLLVVLVMVLISVPAIIMMVSSSRPLPAVVQPPPTEASPAPTSRSIDIVPNEPKQEKPEQEEPKQESSAQENQQQVERTFQSDNSAATETVATAEQLEQEGSATVVEHARVFVAGNWVVVDCERRVVLQCPHKLIDPEPSPGLSPRGGEKVWQGHCRDVSIKLDSFCRN